MGKQVGKFARVASGTFAIAGVHILLHSCLGVYQARIYLNKDQSADDTRARLYPLLSGSPLSLSVHPPTRMGKAQRTTVARLDRVSCVRDYET